jgi:spore coat-associated protein N
VFRSVSVSRLLTLAALGAVAAVCVGAGAARPDRAEPYAVLTNATGDLRISNSRDGQAIFQFSGLAPGRSVSGTVRLTNGGSIPGDLSLQQLDLQDAPGPNGGRLSQAVRLDITDITGGNSVPTFAGPVRNLASRPLGAIGPGAVREFRFKASLPDGGKPPGPTIGDNAYAGSGLTMRYAWNASADDVIAPSGPGFGGGGGTRPHGPIGNTRPRLKFRVDSRRLLKRGWLDVKAQCNRGCTLYVRAKAPKKTRVKVRQRIVTLSLPQRTARIRLKLNRKSRRALARALHDRKRVVLKVEVKMVATGWGRIGIYKRNVTIRRPARRR